MTGAAWAWTTLAIVAAVADWVAVHRGSKVVEYAAKPAVMVFLVGAALALDPETSGARGWFVAALLFSLAGDVFLMLPRDLFVPGLASFLVAHLCYVAGFVTEDMSGAGLVGGLVVVAVGVVQVGRPILVAVRSGPQPELTVPVGLYMAAISAMLAAACGTGDPRAIAGALLFYASDALIAWTKFVEPQPWGPLGIIVTYHLAQVALVLSLT